MAYEVAQALRLGDLRELGPFLFGSAAPDAAQYLGRGRAETHLWTETGVSGALALLRAYPALGAAALTPTERHFLAGYLCHLVTDEQWTLCLWRPYFGAGSRYAGGAEGTALHSALRNTLDREAHRASPSVVDLARSFEDDVPLRPGLLPFLDAGDLARYRIALLPYLNRGAPATGSALHAEALAHVRPDSIGEFRRRALVESTRLLRDYFAGRPLRPPAGTVVPAG